MNRILCIATEWLPKKGGLSTFNRKLCITLAKNNRVYCYLPEFGQEEYQDASNNGVNLLKPKYIAGMDAWNCMNNKPILLENDNIDILIGHDRITGPIMEALRNNYYSGATTIFFIHTSPSEIELYKPEQLDIDHAAKAEEREKIQKDLAKNSSLIVAVGPKLFHEVKTYMAGVSRKPPIVRFDPGLFENSDKINYEFESTIPEALMMGRLEDFHLKGVDIVFKAMDKVYNEWHVEVNNTILKPRLILRGSPIGSDKALRSKLNELVPSSKLVVIIRNYASDVGIINEEIRRSALTLMPSRAEGFGLVALEAISLGRPILVGDNTGFATLIKEIAPEEAHHWIIPADLINDGVEEWAEGIKTILVDRKAAEDRLKRLVEIYSTKISWDSSVRSLIESVTIQSYKEVFFCSDKSNRSDLKFQSFPIWDNKVRDHVGPKAEADFDFNLTDKIIKVTRRNAEGRNIIDIGNYISQNGTAKYIEHNGDPNTQRNIRISFEARVIGSPITLYIIIHEKDNYSWHQHTVVKIRKSDWQEFIIDKTLAANIDFTVQIQEKDFKGNPGVYEMRNYLVRELSPEPITRPGDHVHFRSAKTYVH